MLKQTGYLPQSKPGANAACTYRKESILVMDYLIESVYGGRIFGGRPPTKDFLARFDVSFQLRGETASEQRMRRKTRGTEEIPGRPVTPFQSACWTLVEKGLLFQPEALPSPPNVPGSLDVHPLNKARALIESELGYGPGDIKGPLLNLNYLHIHRLCVHLFTCLDKLLRKDLERVLGRPYEDLVPSELSRPMITRRIASSSDQQLLKKTGEIVHEMFGAITLVEFVISEDVYYPESHPECEGIGKWELSTRYRIPDCFSKP